MFLENLPQGEDALLFDDLHCKVGGLFLYTDFLLELIDVVRDKFSQRLPIDAIYGSPPFKWNAGRLMLDKCPIRKNIEEEFEKLISYGIEPALTLSNPLLQKKDLDDPLGNDLLILLAQYGGTAIVASELLYSYIRREFPTIKLESSIIQTVWGNPRRNATFYENLSRRYDFFVVNVDDNFSFDLLDTLDKKKAEILVNERCYYQCFFRERHYLVTAQEQISQAEGSFNDQRFLQNCDAIPEFKQAYSQKRNISLSMNEYKTLYNMGFHRFKIQGRTSNLYANIFDVLRFTLEPNVAFTQMYPIACELLGNKR